MSVNGSVLRHLDQAELDLIRSHNSPLSYYLPDEPVALCSTFEKMPDERELRRAVHVATFGLNVVKASGCLLPSEVYLVEGVRKKQIKAVHPQFAAGTLAAISQSEYEAKSSLRAANIEQICRKVQSAIAKAPTLIVAISRFNVALCRSDVLDQYIDLAISMEAVVGADAEISHKFSTLLAIITESQKQGRVARAKALKAFYNRRSKLVHGGSYKEADYSSKDLEPIWEMAKAGLLYRLFFADQLASDADWQCCDPRRSSSLSQDRRVEFARSGG